jgi:hypothetical protein
MPRLWYILLAAVLAAAGCNSTGKKPATATNGPNAPGTPTPFWSEDKPTKASSSGPKTEVDGLLAGMLIDSAGRPQPNAVINVAAADAGANARPIGVHARRLDHHAGPEHSFTHQAQRRESPGRATTVERERFQLRGRQKGRQNEARPASGIYSPPRTCAEGPAAGRDR